MCASGGVVPVRREFPVVIQSVVASHHLHFVVF